MNDLSTSTVARLGVSTLALGVFLAAAPVQANCVSNAGTLTCDASAPNPFVAGSSVTVPAVTVGAGSTLTSGAARTLDPVGNPIAVTNSGTIANTAGGGRAIDARTGTTGNITITNNAGALITSADDAVRVNYNPTGGTITVDNYGQIITTGGGQALDFNAANSGGATIAINNYAGAEMKSMGQDGIRPGQGATVDNSGLIYADNTGYDNNDGVDWQQSSGTVNNTATGTISGLRHGITGDVNVNVVNAGTIIGRNGSGVGSDGTGTVDNSGLIRGVWDGVQTNGDGDGVDIDGIGTVVNSGTIEGLTAAGVDSGGRPNSAQGVAMGGGSVTNTATGTIRGGAQGILVNLDTNPGGAAVGATTISNAGTIRGNTAEAIQLVGNFNDGITTSGTIVGGGGRAIDMGGGNDTLTVTGAASFTGSIDGGAGTDMLILGTTTGNTIDNIVNFETLSVTGAGWRIGSNANFANIDITTGSSLTGSAATLTGLIGNAGTLTVDQPTDATFAGTLSGTGSLVKTGAGALTIGNQLGFTGPTTVAQGKLVLAGTLPGTVTVQNGGSLAGNGTVGSTTIQSGGTIVPGNSIGTILVNGNFSALSGSLYVAETGGTSGLADRIAINGTAALASGAQLQIVRDATPYTVGNRYTVLTATGGVTGAYTLLQDTNASTVFRLGGTPTSVFVDVARTTTALIATGGTPNQIATATGLSAVGLTDAARAGNAAYAALTLIPSDALVRAGLDDLSGELHGTLFTSLLDDAAAVQNTVRTRLLDGAEGTSVWATGLRRWSQNDGTGNSADAWGDSWGAIGGIDAALSGNFRAGIAGGMSWNDMAADRRGSTARAESTHVLVYAGGEWGGVRLNLTGGYAWTDLTTRRAVSFIGFTDSLTASYKARTIHGGADLGYKIPLGRGSVEPFAGVEVYSVKRNAFTEAGSVAALQGAETEETSTISSLGARFSTPIVHGLSARGQIAWRHAFGNLAPVSLARFAGGSLFGVEGSPLSEDAAAAEIALRYSTANVALTGSYNGTIDNAGSDSRFQLGLSVSF